MDLHTTTPLDSIQESLSKLVAGNPVQDPEKSCAAILVKQIERRLDHGQKVGILDITYSCEPSLFEKLLQKKDDTYLSPIHLQSSVRRSVRDIKLAGAKSVSVDYDYVSFKKNWWSPHIKQKYHYSLKIVPSDVTV